MVSASSVDDGVDGMWDLGEKVLTLEDVDGVGLLCRWRVVTTSAFRMFRSQK